MYQPRSSVFHLFQLASATVICYVKLRPQLPDTHTHTHALIHSGHVRWRVAYIYKAAFLAFNHKYSWSWLLAFYLYICLPCVPPGRFRSFVQILRPRGAVPILQVFSAGTHQFQWRTGCSGSQTTTPQDRLQWQRDEAVLCPGVALKLICMIDLKKTHLSPDRQKISSVPFLLWRKNRAGREFVCIILQIISNFI